MSKQYILLMLLVLMVSSVSAIGISRPYIDGDIVDIANGVHYSVPFNIQNNENATKSVIFYVETQDPMKINNGARIYQETYSMTPYSNRAIALDFSSTQNAIFKVKYSIKEGGSGSGISMSFGAGDYFNIRVGNGTLYKNLNINLTYPGFELRTNAVDINDVRDLIISSGDVEVDFTGQRINLTGFLPQYVLFGSKSVFLNTSAFQGFSKEASLYFYSIKSVYTIYKDDAACTLSQCKEQSYQSRRVSFKVNPFNGKYWITDKNPDPVTTTTGLSTSGGGSVSIKNGTKINTTVVAPSPVTPPSAVVAPPVVEQKTEEKVASPPPIPQEQIVLPSQIVSKANVVSKMTVQEAKVLLMSSVILCFILLVLSGSLLFYVYKTGVPL